MWWGVTRGEGSVDQAHWAMVVRSGCCCCEAIVKDDSRELNVWYTALESVKVPRLKNAPDQNWRQTKNWRQLSNKSRASRARHATNYSLSNTAREKVEGPKKASKKSRASRRPRR